MSRFSEKLKRVRKKWSWKRTVSNIKFFLSEDITNFEQKKEEMIYRIKDEVLEEYCLEENVIREHIVTLDVLNGPDTLDRLAKEPKSFTRYGDGEIRIMMGQDQPFQKYDPVLARKMREILQRDRTDLYVGLNYAYFDSPLHYAERNRRFYRIHGTEFRRFFTGVCSTERQYLDAACFGAYFRYGDDFDYVAHYEKIKELFRDKDIVIVSGEGVIEKLTYNVFEYANSQQILHAPRLNAFDEYEDILARIQKDVRKDQLLCLILGMTATVLAADLTDLGYMAWDIGHIAKDYNAYMMREEKSRENMDKFWAPD